MVPEKFKVLKPGLQVDEKDLLDSQKKLLEWSGPGFDLRTHIIDPNTGTLICYQPYRRTCGSEGVIYFRQDAKGVEKRYSESGRCLDIVPDTKKAAVHDKKLSA